MLSTSTIIDAIKAGKKVTSCGNTVVAENIDYEWETPALRVKLKNGASYPLEGSERRAVEIHDYGIEGDDYLIISNGSHWKDTPPSPIDSLLERLSTTPLDPHFASNGVKSVIKCSKSKCTESELEFDGHHSYIGNFYGVSANFNIWVKRGSRLERELDKLVEANINSTAYKKAFQEYQS